MRAKRLFTVLTFFIAAVFYTPAAAAGMLTATGIGKTEADARNDALGSLATMLYMRVTSTSQGMQNMKEKNGKLRNDVKELRRSVTVTTDVPLLGVEYSPVRTGSGGMVEIDALLDPAKVSPLYDAEIAHTAQKLEALLLSLGNPQARADAQTLYDDYDRLAGVARVIGLDAVQPISMNRTAFDAAVMKYAGSVNTLKAAADEITKGIKQKKIYVYAASFEGLQGVSDFSYLLQQYITADFGTQAAVSEKKASYFLSGTYLENKTGADDGSSLDVTYRLVNNRGRIVASSPVVTVLPEAFAGRSYIPEGNGFQEELASAAVSDDDLFADIRINGTRDNLSFPNGSVLFIDVKVSESCLLYIVGYVFNKNSTEQPFAYLYPFDVQKSGKAVFVRKIGKDEVNTWVNVNPADENGPVGIEVIPPFGTEVLQVVAVSGESEQNFYSRIPDYHETEDYYIVGKDPVHVVQQTRALNIKRKAQETAGKVKCTESSVTFMTTK